MIRNERSQQTRSKRNDWSRVKVALEGKSSDGKKERSRRRPVVARPSPKEEHDVDTSRETRAVKKGTGK